MLKLKPIEKWTEQERSTELALYLEKGKRDRVKGLSYISRYTEPFKLEYTKGQNIVESIFIAARTLGARTKINGAKMQMQQCDREDIAVFAGYENFQQVPNGLAIAITDEFYNGYLQQVRKEREEAV